MSLVYSSLKFSQVSVKINEAQEVITVCFPNEYSHVILNILNNAKEAIAAQKVKGKITIDVFRENDFAVVKIQDNGCGIPGDILDKIFDPYFTTKEGEGGTGLGLYLSKVIIEDHMEGYLGAQNIPHGTEFKIITPIYSSNTGTK